MESGQVMRPRKTHSHSLTHRRQWLLPHLPHLALHCFHCDVEVLLLLVNSSSDPSPPLHNNHHLVDPPPEALHAEWAHQLQLPDLRPTGECFQCPSCGATLVEHKWCEERRSQLVCCSLH